MARIEQPTSVNGRHTDMPDDGNEDVADLAADDDAMTDAAHGTEEAMTDAGSEPDFMDELATAMRGVAARERERLTSRAADDAAGHIAEARAHGATEAEAIRRVADEDIASIKTWAEAEVARIRDDAAARVAERRSDLDAALVRHESVIQSEVDGVAVALTSYDASLNAFMDDLDEVRDPTEIARLAVLLPARPDLARIREDARTAALDRIASEAVLADAAIGEVAEAESVEAESASTDAMTESPAEPSLGDEPPLSDALATITALPTSTADVEAASVDGSAGELDSGATEEPASTELAEADAATVPAEATDVETSPAPVGVMDLGSMVDDLQAGASSDSDGPSGWDTDDSAAIAELRGWDTGVAVVPERTGWELETSAAPAVAEAVGTLDPIETAVDAPAATAAPGAEAEPLAHPFGHTNAAVRLIRSVAPWTAPTANKENGEHH